jgi:hypothetical protein
MRTLEPYCAPAGGLRSKRAEVAVRTDQRAAVPPILGFVFDERNIRAGALGFAGGQGRARYGGCNEAARRSGDLGK